MLFEIGENVMQDKQSLLKHVMAREGALARAGQTGKMATTMIIVCISYFQV